MAAIVTLKFNNSMPEVQFELEWPDGKCSTLYSPSTVIHNYLKAGDTMSVAELESLGTKALRKASERVRERFGFACTRTDEQEAQLREWVSRYDPKAIVRVSNQLP